MRTLAKLAILVLALGLATKVAKADFTFGTPTNLGPVVNSSARERRPSLPADGLSLFFHSDRGGGYGGEDIWVTTRATKADPWGEPVNLGPTVNTSTDDYAPSISADGSTLYFMSNRPGGSGGADLWVATRATLDDDWGGPVNLGPTVNTSAIEGGPTISADGLSLYFHSTRPGGYGGYDIWVTTRATKADPWGTPVNLGPPVNSSANDFGPSISVDGLSLFFHSYRPGGYGQNDIWVTRRAAENEDWGSPVNLGPTVNSSATDRAPTIPANGLTLYFESFRPEGSGIWQAPIIPIVDFNGDGIVDSADMCIMVNNWHTDNTLCDIGPMPWGDGIMDVQDLIVLAEHLFTYPGAVAHWKLDETEGSITYDSIGDNDGTLNGEPLWQPSGGKVDGALEFDGIDDYVSTPLMLDPANAAFSVFAWIKGGAPGQVIISQIGGANWLLADPAEGKLMTELRNIGGRTNEPALLSQMLITDGAWHCVGFVWDGSNRILYADGAEVARDTQPGLGSSEGGLYFGAGATLEAANFFSGLIDDVRIYDRAITP